MNVRDTAEGAVSPNEAPVARPAAEPAPFPQTIGASVVDSEVLVGFRAWRVWVVLGWNDIRQRYRRSVLGPFWITLSMGIFILMLGIIYSRLFHTPIGTYLPFLSVGYIIWGFISSVTNEAALLFTRARN